jgi:subtilisin family serine protease
METYVILRDKQKSAVFDPFKLPTYGSASDFSGLGTGPRPQIEVEPLDNRDRLDLMRDPEVQSLTPVMPVQLIKPTDISAAASTRSWGVDAINAAGSTYTGAGVKVAIIDSGIDVAHPAFNGVNLVVRDFTGTGDHDVNGHGTHCAGTFFGRDVAGARIGVATGIETAFVAKVLDGQGAGTTAAVFSAIEWAMNSGVLVISMSLGFDFSTHVQRKVDAGWPADLATSHALESYRGSLRMFDALLHMMAVKDEHYGPGPVVVAASGNESRRNVNVDYVIGTTLPAAASGVISVGAVSDEGARYRIAPFSNAFPVVCAPGVDIVSAAAGGGMASMSGTSMACPHVAGIAAMWWEKIRTEALPYRASTVESKLLASAEVSRFDADTAVIDRGLGMVGAP